MAVALETCYLHSLNALEGVDELLILFLSNFEVILLRYLDGIFLFFFTVALKIIYFPNKWAKHPQIDLLDTVKNVRTNLDKVLWSEVYHKILIVDGQDNGLFVYPAKLTRCC